MKIRAIKSRLIRQIRTVKTAVVKPVLYPVFRKKDDLLVAAVQTEAAATALVIKAKAAKKASLYVGTPATHYHGAV